MPNPANLKHAAALMVAALLDYVRAHPEDPLAPEALALTVRATHLGASDWNDATSAKEEAAASTALSKAAFELLHSRYPQTEWAKKTKYYY